MNTLARLRISAKLGQVAEVRIGQLAFTTKTTVAKQARGPIEWTEAPPRLEVSQLAAKVRRTTLAAWPDRHRRSVTQNVRQQNSTSENQSMNTRLITLATVAVFAGCSLLISLSGCGKRTPPGPSTIGMSAPGMNITFLRWNEGLMVLFVDNVKGSPHSAGSGSTENPVRTQSGSVGDVNAGGYRWQLETADGKSADCRINGRDYDLSKGGLFVITTKGEQAEVNQLKRDLSTIPFDTDGCREALVKDAEIRKVLGLDERPE